ncbi:ATP-binding protein [Streptomyces sp. NPDC058251]|uniref:ATP-binding protein n=1 Tax=unclassified Streptomyces TaxID=2593676 RepID=UPI0036EFC314
MTTTALRTPRAELRDREVMRERMEVVPRRGDGPPRTEDAHQVGVLRRIAAARLRQCGLQELRADVMVLVSELLTNAVLHSGTREISLSLSVRGGFLHIAVTDGMPGNPARKDLVDDDESGRGLALVEALVQEHGGTWGTSNAGAQTWCTLAVSKGQP